VDDDTTFVEGGDDGAKVIEFVRVDFLITFNIDVGGITLITSLFKLNRGSFERCRGGSMSTHYGG
jgi:hypothetical protein